MARREGLANVRFQQADLSICLSPPTFRPHLRLLRARAPGRSAGRPGRSLPRAQTGGSITVIEGDHAPPTSIPRPSWPCARGTADPGPGRPRGNSLIGRSSIPCSRKPLPRGQRFAPRDLLRPEPSRLPRRFCGQDHRAHGGRRRAAGARDGLLTPAEWRQGVADLYRIAECPRASSTTPSSKPSANQVAPCYNRH